MDGVKYYGPNDWAIGGQLNRAERVLTSFDCNRADYSLMEIIELFNIKRYLDDGAYLKSWSEADIKNFGQVARQFMRHIGRFMSQITNENIEIICAELPTNSQADFLEMMVRMKAYVRIEWEKIAASLLQKSWYLRNVLVHKELVKHFDQDIRGFLLSSGGTYAELLLENEIDKPFSNKSSLHYPPSLTDADREKILLLYIHGIEVNLNYLRLINGMCLSDSLRYAANTRELSESEAFFDNGSGVLCGTEVRFQTQSELIRKEHIEGYYYKYSYDIDYVQNNLEYDTLINNMHWLFGLFDRQARITSPSKESEAGIFERVLNTWSKNDYRTYMSFTLKESTSNNQFTAYYYTLKGLGVSFEAIIEWVLKEYFLREFGVHDFIVHTPSAGSTFLEKCRSLASEMEFVLKQFRLFVAEGSINHGLLQFSSKPLSIRQIPSLVESKYVYSTQSLDYVQHLLFSDQSTLAHLGSGDVEYNSLYELLSKEPLRLDECHDFQKEGIHHLESLEILKIESEGVISFRDKLLVRLLWDLYSNEVLSYWHLSEAEQNAIKELSQKELVHFGSSLFSECENDYFDYILNKSLFTNGPDIRNRYIHGTQLSGDPDDNEHRENYFILLKLLVLMLIKINDDFCIHANGGHPRR